MTLARYSLSAVESEMRELKARTAGYLTQYADEKDRAVLEKAEQWILHYLCTWSDYIHRNKPKKAELKEAVAKERAALWDLECKGLVKNDHGFAQVTRGGIPAENYGRLVACNMVFDLID